MNNETFERVKTFTCKETGRSAELITESAALEDDLDIYGDDAFEFIVAFGKEFNVDVTNFMAADYFRGEGGLVLLPILNKLFGIKKRNTRKRLTIAHLVKAVKAGRLDEEVINS